jgi:drug/metabolite transporter (DMT)-like permease
VTAARYLPAVGLALGAAASFAVANVTQMDAVSRRAGGSGAGVLVRVARDPLWLVGLVASIVGFGLEATALSIAPVVLVQPLIVAELPFALPLAAMVAGRRLGSQEWAGIGLVTLGLAGVVAAIRPANTPIVAGAGVWFLLFGATALFTVGLVTAGRHRGPVVRTSLLAGAAGASFGLLSVVTKAATHEFARHGLGALVHWQPWALAAVGLSGMTLAQNAYQAGPLAVSLPLLDLGEPIVGSTIALAAFHERLIGFGPGPAVLLTVAVILILAGVAALDRSPLVRGSDGPAGGDPEPGAGHPPGAGYSSRSSPSRAAPAVTKSISDSTAPTSDGSRSA